VPDRTEAPAKRELRLSKPALHRAMRRRTAPPSIQNPELLPLGSRVRARLELSALTPQDLASYLHFILQKAGDPQLIAPELIQTPGTPPRTRKPAGVHPHHMAAELLTAAERNLPRIDEPLYFDLFTLPVRQSRRS
jgi:general secretion pathway protein A